MADKPKITGLGFNLFAIVAVLIFLPIGTSTISSLSTSNSQEYVSVNEMIDMNDPSLCYAPFGESSLLNWVDKGVNSTKAYMDNNPSSVITDYETIYDESGSYYGNYMLESCLGQIPHYRNDDQFFVSFDNHYSLRLFEPNHAGYIGYSGTDFTFRVDENYFKFIPDDEEISKLKFTFINSDETFNCALEGFFQELQYKSDIKFLKNNLNPYELNNFEFERSNKYKVEWLPLNTVPNNQNGTGQPYGEICHIKIVLEYELSPFEVIEFNERFSGDYDNLSAYVRVYDINAVYNATTQQMGFTSSTPVPFTGDWKSGVLFEVAYIDIERTNFFLSGGTLILGLGLFLLAIASTQYWDPVIGFFKPDGV